MRTVLVHLVVLLCILMQVVYGSTYRAGLVLCVPMYSHEHDDGDGDEDACAGECCHHHGLTDRPTEPSQDHRGPCCVDVRMPYSTLPTAHLLGLDDGGWKLAAAFDLPSAILPGPEFGGARACERWLSHPPDRVASRIAPGLRTTRLLI